MLPIVTVPEVPKFAPVIVSCAAVVAAATVFAERPLIHGPVSEHFTLKAYGGLAALAAPAAAAVVTTTLAGPAGKPLGTVAVIANAPQVTLAAGAGVPPNDTEPALVPKFVPLILTACPEA